MTRRWMFGSFGPAFAVGLALTTVAGGQAARAEEGPFPHLVHARWELKQAKEELKDKRFGRFKREELADIDAALDEVDRALRAAKVDWDYNGPEKPDEYYKDYREFPHLHHAAHELREAKKELEDERFRPSRERSIRAIDKALDRLEAVLK